MAGCSEAWPLSVRDNFSLFENLQIINENATDLTAALRLSHWLPVCLQVGTEVGNVFVLLVRCPAIILVCCYQLTDFRATVNISFHPEIELPCSPFLLQDSPLKLDGNNTNV